MLEQTDSNENCVLEQADSNGNCVLEQIAMQSVLEQTAMETACWQRQKAME